VTEVPPQFRAAIIAVRPDLRDVPMVLHTMGWDSQAVEAVGTMFKFPKNAVAAERLKREARYLDLIRPRVAMIVPELRIRRSGALTFSEHRMIPGRIIETNDFLLLDEVQRDAMAAALGAFYAALHDIPIDEALAAGAVYIPDWPSALDIIGVAGPVIPATLHGWMARVLEAFAELPQDEDVTGYFDGHGWNMAFDHERGVLNGVYDFADGGVGPRHREFSYGAITSTELAERTIEHYERLTDRPIKLRTVTLHAVVRALSEAGDADDDTDRYVRSIVAWHDYTASRPELTL
jgi:hypothetical protein